MPGGVPTAITREGFKDQDDRYLEWFLLGTDAAFTPTIAREIKQGDDVIETDYAIKPIGVIRSSLTSREAAPNMGYEGAPDAWLEMDSTIAEGLDGIAPGSEIILITWLHKAHRDTLKVHPRRDQSRPLTGVFATRSPDRPNPIGLHRVTVLEISEHRLKVGPLEAIDGTPIVDIKPVLQKSSDSS